MAWFDPEDRSRPVIEPLKQAASKYPDNRLPELPERAVVFCTGKGLPILRERFSCFPILDKMPGFITHSEVLGTRDSGGVCFLHGGYGAPQIACTVETLRVLGVKEICLVGLCGAFDGRLSVGDVVIPKKVLSEEGTSLHYMRETGFARVMPPVSFDDIAAWFGRRGHTVHRGNTVTTDAVFRQTFNKERLWREAGCVAVDMEASALVNICGLYGMKNTVILMVSDRHPLSEDEPEWEWGAVNYEKMYEKFILDCIAFNM